MAGTGGSWRPPRSCEDYWGEWKHCRGLRHAFHHYYAHGELPDCGRWREDYEACRAWERDRAAAAQEKPPRYRQKAFLGCPEMPLATAPRTLEDTSPAAQATAELLPPASQDSFWRGRFRRSGSFLHNEALCKSERARVMEKQKYAPVWKLRKSPPPDWYLPLDHDKSN